MFGELRDHRRYALTKRWGAVVTSSGRRRLIKLSLHEFPWKETMLRTSGSRFSTASSLRAALCATAVLTVTAVGCTSLAPTADQANTSAQTSEKPNILMILLDDLGYTDLGPYGGDAATPNIDALAQEGLQFTNFHSYSVCAPTRAALMTGQDPHRVGLGSMEGFTAPGVPTTTPGYQGSLDGNYTGIAEILSAADYSTYQVGKWHLGESPEQTPAALGFDQNFTLYDGAASHYDDKLRHARAG